MCEISGLFAERLDGWIVHQIEIGVVWFNLHGLNWCRFPMLFHIKKGFSSVLSLPLRIVESLFSHLATVLWRCSVILTSKILLWNRRHKKKKKKNYTVWRIRSRNIPLFKDLNKKIFFLFFIFFFFLTSFSPN